MFRQTLHSARPAAAGVLRAADPSPAGLAGAALAAAAVAADGARG